MDVINDLSDPLKQLAFAVGKHAVQADLAKHVVNVSGTDKQITIQQALGQASQLFFDNAGNPFWVGGGWDALEKLYYGPQDAGAEITADNYRFHPGGPADAPDDLFPDDIPHPKASYYSAQLPAGLADDNNPGNMFGIFRTLVLPNYNEDGQQVDIDGDPIPGGANPNDYLWYSASPQREISELYRRSRRNLVNINWPAWCYLRDWNATLIPWDDGKLTPHQIKVDPAAGGSIAPGTKIWVRVATLKAGDISSASHDVADDGYTEAAATVGGGGAVTAIWASQLERDADGYRVYVGTAKGAQDRYFTVGSGATNTLTITTLAGATMGPPPEICTGVLLRNVARFESHLYSRPPFRLSTIVDRIAQISCMDWNYSGGKMVLVSPELQEPIVTLDRSLLTNFKTYPVDQRENWNQIVGTYRDLDDPNLAPAAKPVVVNRFDLQQRNGLISKQIDFGCAYRSQVERGCHYWARRLIDSNQMVEKWAAPRIYRLLPANAIAVTHNVPNWTAVPFYIETKEENEDVKAGYQMTAQLYGEWYSDTDHSPMPRPLPQTNPSVFLPPPVVTSCALTEAAVELTSGAPFTVIKGDVQFAGFAGRQRGRVWIKKPGGVYEQTQMVLFPEPATLQQSFEWPVIAIGTYKVKIVTESDLGVSANFGDHPEFTLNVTGDLIRARMATDGVVQLDGFGDFLETFIGHPRASEQPATYVVEVWDNDNFGVDPGTHRKGFLPVKPGSSHASLLNAGFQEGGWYGNPPDEDVGGSGAGAYSVFTTTHIYRNNLYSFPWDGGEGPFGTPVSGVTLEALTKTYQWFDFGLQFFGSNTAGSAFAASIGLQTRANADPVSSSFAPDPTLCPVFVVTSAGTVAGTIKLTFKSFNVDVFELDNVDPGFSEGFGAGSDPSVSPKTRPGPRLRFQLSGAEYRVSLNPELGRAPLIVISSGTAGPAFPLRLAAACTGVSRHVASAITNIQSGGDFLTTTYSVANQIAFQGARQTRVYLRAYQKSRYEQIPDGLPLDIVAPPL